MIRPGVGRLFRLPIRRRGRLQRELEDEIGLHLEMRVAQLTARGWSEEAARAEAARRFGSVPDARRELLQAARERDSTMHFHEWRADLRQDIGFALRTMLKHPGFTAAVLLTLALGIGASSTMFTVVDGVLLRPFGFHEPERLVVLAEIHPDGEPMPGTSPLNYTAWSEQTRSLEGVAAFGDGELILTGRGDAEEIPIRRATRNYFSVLGRQPLLGRAFTAEDEGADVAVLSHGLWQQRFGGDRNLVGTTITLNETPVTVIGVMPADLPSLQGDPALWIQLNYNPEWHGRFLRVIGRLRPGITLEQANADVARVGAQQRQAYPQWFEGWGAKVIPLQDAVSGDVRPALLILLGAVGLLLLIACANVANLLLSRAAVRRKEVAVRRALGATRGRLMRQLLTESVLLAGVAGALGLVIAVLGTRMLVTHLAGELALPRLDAVGVDARVVTVTLLVSILTGIAFGIAPALFGSSAGPAETMRESGRGNTGSRERGRLRSAFVVAEVALALMLLVGAGLLARSFQQLASVDPGIDAEHAIAMRVAARPARYQDPAVLIAFRRELQTRLEALPGAAAVGTISPWLPLTGSKGAQVFQRADRAPAPHGESPGADIRFVGGDYYQAMGMPVLQGRVFDDRDNATSPDVIVINQALANRYFPGENPVGKTIIFEWGEVMRAEIIGVVGSVREMGPMAESAAAIYAPFDKRPDDLFHMVVRSTADPAALATSMRDVVRQIDPNLPIATIRTMDDIAGQMIARPRLNMMVLGGFAAIALILATIGLYGVIAYTVAQQRAEIGVRVALGARRADVLRLVVGHGMRLTAAGLAAGLLGAFILTRLMTSLLFGVQPTDPLTLAAVAGFLSLVALVACWIPARRAARTDPAIALRAE